MIAGVQQTHHVLWRERCVLNDRLVDGQELVPDGQRSTPISDTRRQYIPHVHSRRHYLVQLLQGVGLQCIRVQVVAQDQPQLLIQWPLDLNQQRTQRVLNALHNRHVVLDGQVAEAGQVALAFEDLLGF